MRSAQNSSGGLNLSLHEVAQGGDRAATLMALRDEIAAQIDATDSGRDVAALSRQLTDVLMQIEKVAPTKATGDPIDEISQRRAARRARPA